MQPESGVIPHVGSVGNILLYFLLFAILWRFIPKRMSSCGTLFALMIIGLILGFVISIAWIEPMMGILKLSQSNPVWARAGSVIVFGGLFAFVSGYIIANRRKENVQN